MLEKLRRHLRRGDLWETLHWRLTHRMSARDRARYEGVRDARDAERFFVAQGRRHAHDLRGALLLIGDGGALQQAVARRLRRHGVRVTEAAHAVLPALPAGAADCVAVLCVLPRMADITRAAAALLADPVLAEKPFEYVAGLDPAEALFRARDEYRDTVFVSPLLLEAAPVHEIYAESLARFEQKCGLRDWLDLAQAVIRVVKQDVPGDLAEFGSFRGHSGWLTARLLQALGSGKTLYLFDMFERFPEESAGIDRFWSATHSVNFDEVRARFAELPNVRFVKGDFTRTLETSPARTLALAYIDCDSYRATKYLVEAIFGPRLSPDGVLIVEDYGHPALLGSRLAVQETLANRSGAYCHFSAFSGLYFAHKLPAR